MTINKAKDYLNTLLNTSTKKSEIRVYQKFVLVLTGLENRNLSNGQINLIEQKLTALELNQQTKNRKRYIGKKLNTFVNYLDTAFSFILKDHFANYGLSIGMVFGVAIGTAIFRDSGGSTTGMCIGMFAGYIIGLYLDNEAAKNGKVLIIT